LPKFLNVQFAPETVRDGDQDFNFLFLDKAHNGYLHHDINSLTQTLGHFVVSGRGNLAYLN